MNKWVEMKKRHQEEFNAFPVHYAFGQEQIDRKIAELHLDPDRYKDQIEVVGFGGFVLKEDAPRLKEMWVRHEKERQAAIDADGTGEGFIYDMFRYELENHEFSYTGSTEETLDCLGYTSEDVEADPRLKRGLKKAMIDAG